MGVVISTNVRTWRKHEGLAYKECYKPEEWTKNGERKNQIDESQKSNCKDRVCVRVVRGAEVRRSFRYEELWIVGVIEVASVSMPPVGVVQSSEKEVVELVIDDSEVCCKCESPVSPRSGG